MIGFKDFVRLLEVDQNIVNQLNKIRNDIAVLDQRRAKLFIMQTQLEKKVAAQNAQEQKMQQAQQANQQQAQQGQQQAQPQGQQPQGQQPVSQPAGQAPVR